MTTGPSLASPHPFGGFRAIYAHMSAPRRRQLFVLLVLMLLNAIAELGTIGAVLPLLAFISHPSSLDHYPSIVRVLNALGFGSPAQRLVGMTAIFCAFAVAGGLFRFELMRSTYKFGYAFAHEIALKIHQRLLAQPYAFHVARNSSSSISAFEKAEVLVFEVLLPIVQAFTAAFVSAFIVAILVAVNPAVTVVALAALTSIYLLASRLASSRLAANSEVLSDGISKRVRIVQESLGGIRDVILDRSQPAHVAAFDAVNRSLADAYTSTAIISLAPRFLVETVAIVAIAGVAVIAVADGDGLTAAIPTLGALALGAQRLLPLVQQVYRGWSSAAGHLSIVGECVNLLNLPAPTTPAEASAPLRLADEIVLDQVSFVYPSRNSAAVEDISLRVPAGAMLALTGTTGSGKSTLADLIMGLLEPTDGSVIVDGRELTGDNVQRWWGSIAHVPQSIFLADATIAENIALSRPHVPADREQVIEATKRAQLHGFITSLPEGYDSRIGERGIRLSGGQRQRLGLARAIYKDAPVMVLDEATSALDQATEDEVLQALRELQSQGRTIIIIAHRLSTIRHCDQVVRLNHGRIVEQGSFSELYGAQASA